VFWPLAGEDWRSHYFSMEGPHPLRVVVLRGQRHVPREMYGHQTVERVPKHIVSFPLRLSVVLVVSEEADTVLPEIVGYPTILKMGVGRRFIRREHNRVE
jgi:hypothetical protein